MTWMPRVTITVLTCLGLSIGAAPAQRPSGDEGPRFGKVNPKQMARMLSPENDGPFYMINLIQFREKAVYADGRETDLTGEEANALYSPVAELQKIGARPVFVARVEDQRLGDDTEWDQVAIVYYPSRKAFLEMLQRPEFQERSIHKDAGVGRSTVMVSRRIDPPTPPGFTPQSPPFPATAEDRPLELIHVLRYRDEAEYASAPAQPLSGREAMGKYDAAAGPVALPLGAYPTAWFEIEGVYIGDERSWDEVRIHHFPSHATLEKHLADESRAAAERHREAGLADVYSLQTLPVFNRLGSP
ncbi:MAG: hypothetical protein AAGK22_14260 [Acidobacteriota bacterium]